MKQLHVRDTWKKLTEEQRNTILESQLFLKENIYVTLKGRTVAGGNKQRCFISREDARSPTVTPKPFILMFILDAEEHLYVATVDIPNVFIQTFIKDKKDMVIIKIRGVFVDILMEIAPDIYGTYVITDRKGVNQLIAQHQNAIYVTMAERVLYYKKFRKSLEYEGYKFNSYDLCVANKIIKGIHMTVCFHVDDCKLSQKSPKVVGKTITWLNQ